MEEFIVFMQVVFLVLQTYIEIQSPKKQLLLAIVLGLWTSLRSGGGGGVDKRVGVKTSTLSWAGSPRNLPGSTADYQLHKSPFTLANKHHLNWLTSGFCSQCECVQLAFIPQSNELAVAGIKQLHLLSASMWTSDPGEHANLQDEVGTRAFMASHHCNSYLKCFILCWHFYIWICFNLSADHCDCTGEWTGE